VPLDNVVFWVFAPIAVGSAIAMLLMRNAVHAALLLVVNFFCLAVMYLLLDAPFLFAVQIIVYTGAIMVLFLFVIMLLGVDRHEDLREPLIAQRPVAIGLGLAVAVEIGVAVHAGVGFATKAPAGFDAVNADGNTQALARVLFTRYFFPFEVTSVLLIIAAIAAMVLAQRRARAVTQSELDEIAARAEAAAPVEEPESAPARIAGPEVSP
jgi:NADH-quinone oxidoreductase subunit J